MAAGDGQRRGDSFGRRPAPDEPRCDGLRRDDPSRDALNRDDLRLDDLNRGDPNRDDGAATI